MMKSITKFFSKKWVIGLVVLIAAGGGFYAFKAHGQTQPLRYVVTPATQGTLVVSLSGSGQVAGQNQLDIKPEVSANVTQVLVKVGQTVKAGEPMFQLDPTNQLKAIRDAQQSVNDSQISLAATELSYKKDQEPPDAASLLQAQDSLNQAQRSLADLQKPPDANDLEQAQLDVTSAQQNAKLAADGVTPQVVRDAYNNIVPDLKNISQTIQQSLSDADSVLGIDNPTSNLAYVNLFSALDTSKKLNADDSYPAAKAAAADVETQTDALPDIDADPAAITAAMATVQNALNIMSPLLQNTYEALLETPTSASFSQSSLNSLESNMQSDHSNISSKLTTIVSEQQSIVQAQDSYTSALNNVTKAEASLAKLQEPADPNDVIADQEKITEAQEALDKLKAGPDPIDLQIAQNSIASRQSSLAETETKLSDAQALLSEYTVVAPFDGVVAAVDAQVASQTDSSPADSGTALATLLTTDKIATITLNEVDAAKVQVGQKATLTFDALPNITIAGTVSEVDQIGTVSQGVVSYTIKVAFDTEDPDVKPGMSVTAQIITGMAQDALLIPSSAVKAQGADSIVQVLTVPAGTNAASANGITSDTPPSTVVVQTGLSNDNDIQVTSGLNAGDEVVTRTIDPNTTTAAASATTNSTAALRGLTGGGGLGGGATFTAGGGGATFRAGGAARVGG